MKPRLNAPLKKMFKCTKPSKKSCHFVDIQKKMTGGVALLLVVPAVDTRGQCVLFMTAEFVNGHILLYLQTRK